MFIKEIGGVKLAANVLTFIKYKAYTGRDLLKDIVQNNRAQFEYLKLLDQYGDKLTDSDKFAKMPEAERDKIFERLDKSTNTQEFLIDFIVALIASAEHPARRAKDDIASGIPMDWITPGTDEHAQIIEILDGILPNQKKTLPT